MKLFLTLSFLAITSANAIAGKEVIYGSDNRKDIYQVTNSLHKTLARSTAGMVRIAQLQKAREGVFKILNQKSLEQAANICPAEAFTQQTIAPICSGFLVGPDTLITAGHCYKAFSTPEDVCRDFAWVFDYGLDSAKANPADSISIANIYRCKAVIHAELSETLDFSIIKLDRPVVGREPLKFRQSGKVSDSASLVVIGHPTGLPSKVSDGGKVNKNVEKTTFSTNLDTFHGNSGSAVFNAKTGTVEGILIQGKNDYVPSIAANPTSCKVANRCDDNGENCTGGVEVGPIQYGEVVLRMPSIASKIKAALK